MTLQPNPVTKLCVLAVTVILSGCITTSKDTTFTDNDCHLLQDSARQDYLSTPPDIHDTLERSQQSGDALSELVRSQQEKIKGDRTKTYKTNCR